MTNANANVDVHQRARVLLLCVAVAALTSACTATQEHSTVNVALAHVRSAELDATYTYYSTTLTRAGVEHAEGRLSADSFRRVYAAGANLHRALTLAHSEQKLYLIAGTNLPAYDAAFVELKKARTELELTVEGAYKHGST